MMADVEVIGTRMLKGHTLKNSGITLSIGDFSITIRSNSTALLARLKVYFRHVIATGEPALTRELLAIEAPVDNFGLEFTDWAREPGKAGRKDAYVDFFGGRLVKKVRTGMIFLQSQSRVIAIGPCLENMSQVINFINTQYMNFLQRNDWLICHAAALVREGRAFGIAGLSGGGKSTLMLKMLEAEHTTYLTNDRLFVRGTNPVMAAGIPKWPRINPGTALNNPRLAHLIPPTRRKELSAMSKEALWDVEEKYDVDIEREYGPGRFAEPTSLNGFLILNWSRDDPGEWRIEPVDLHRRRDLLPAVMKSPGPFYQRVDGSFWMDDTPLDEEAYLTTLTGVPFYEVTGRIDFEGVAHECLGHLPHT